MKVRLLALLVVSGVLLLSACSGADQPATDSTTVGPTAENRSTSTEPSSEPVAAAEVETDSKLSGDDLLVEIEARWMQEVQRFAYPDLDSMNEAFADHLTPHGLTRADYDAFKARMETSADLRRQVLDAYNDLSG